MDPSTALFLQLRYLLCGDATFPKGILDIESRLRELRSQSLELFKRMDRNIFGDFYILFIECWRTFSLLKHDVTNRFALPTLYYSKAMESTLRACAQTLFMVEMGDRLHGNHPIYYGCKGVGKTTVLDAIGKIGAVLLEKCMPLYWPYDYEPNFYPSLAVLVAASRRLEALVMSAPSNSRHADCFINILREECENMQPPPEITTADKSSTDTWARPIFLIDEITSLYHSNDVQVGVLVEMRMYGKTVSNIAIFLTASCTDIERYVYLYPNKRHARMYPDMNNTVFIARNIRPIRDTSDLAEYTKLRYPGWDIDPGLLLEATGGIGRFVVNLYENRAWDPPTVADKVFSDKALFCVFSALLASMPSSSSSVVADDQDRRKKSPWPIWSMGFASALELVEKQGYATEEAVLRINAWCDSLIFYKDNLANLSFLIPASAKTVSNTIDADTHLRFAKGLSLTLTGFSGGSSSAVGHSSVDDFLCEFIHTIVGVPLSSKDTLVLGEAAGATLRVCSEKREEESPVITDVDSLVGVLLKWSKSGCETAGIDRIWLVRDELDDSVVIVSGLLVKTSKIGLSMTAGILKSQRSRKTCATVDATTIAGVLVNAERGFTGVLTGLKSAFPLVRFKLGALHIFTTKKALEARDKFCAQNPGYEGLFTVSGDCSEQLPVVAIDADSPLSFVWHVHDGQEAWIKDILPATVRGLFE